MTDQPMDAYVCLQMACRHRVHLHLFAFSGLTAGNDRILQVLVLLLLSEMDADELRRSPMRAILRRRNALDKQANM